MEHTKGPWIYEPATKTIRSKPANYWLATMDSWDGAVDNEANARLIAAAPELLEACKLLRKHVALVGHPYQPVIQAAIAKAEGRS